MLVQGIQRPVRRVLRLVERTISAGGQQLIVAEHELDGWTTTLPRRIGAQQIVDLYADHGTHEHLQVRAAPSPPPSRGSRQVAEPNFLRAAHVRIEPQADLAMPDVADGNADAQFAAIRLGAGGLEHAGSEHAEFELADTALHAQ